jgi:hypothetical protein
MMVESFFVLLCKSLEFVRNNVHFRVSVEVIVVNMALNLWLPYNCAQYIDALVEYQLVEKDSAECRLKGREHMRVCG